MAALVALCVGVFLALVPGSVRAVEPVHVSVVASIEITDENRLSVREQAFEQALLEAVLEIARQALPPATFELEEERLRADLAPIAARSVLNYRPDGVTGIQIDPGPPERELFVVPIAATVDAAQVSERLSELGYLGGGGRRPSVALVVRAPQGPELPLDAFEQTLRRSLRAQGYTVVEPALRSGAGRLPRSADELARAVGAEVGVDVGVLWRTRRVSGGVVGGDALVQLRAQRVSDGSELARLAFETPSYHANAAEAMARALEALEEQVVRNLLLQLDRNWQVLDRPEGPIRLVVMNLGGFSEVEAVLEQLDRLMQPKSAQLRLLGPLRAEFELSSKLSPGSLQDLLIGTAFPGFELEPVQVTADRVELAVARIPELLAPEPVGIPPVGPR